MQLAIRARGMSKRYGRHAVVDGLDLSVPSGAIYGFLGRNGAGKTTTLRMLLGLIRADAGSFAFFGQSGRGSEPIGSLIEAPTIWGNLSGRKNLDITRRLLGTHRDEVARVLELCGLTAAADRRAGGYSLGMRQRLGIARALIGRPRLLLLDEPTNGLDPEGIAEVRHLMTRLSDDGVTVMVSSHLLDEIERVATHVGLIADGRMILEGPITEIRALASPVVEVASGPGASAALRSAGLTVEEDGDQLRVRGDAAERIAALLVTAGHPVHRLLAHERRLEQVFADVTRQRAA